MRTYRRPFICFIPLVLRFVLLSNLAGMFTGPNATVPLCLYVNGN